MGNLVNRQEAEQWIPNIRPETENNVNFPPGNEKDANQPRATLPVKELVIMFAAPAILIATMVCRETYWWNRERKAASQASKKYTVNVAEVKIQAEAEARTEAQRQIANVNAQAKATVQREVHRQVAEVKTQVKAEAEIEVQRQVAEVNAQAKATVQREVRRQAAEVKEKSEAEFKRQMAEIITQATSKASTDTRQQIYRDLLKLESEEEKTQNGKAERLLVYDRGLEHILDIKCSHFKSSAGREQVQSQLLTRLHSNDIDLLHMTYPGIKSVIANDDKFCGKTMKENGKLRHVYAENWRLQLDLEKHKAILQRLKIVIPTPPGTLTEEKGCSFWSSWL